jgi:DNA-binding transcriptional MerR regulator
MSKSLKKNSETFQISELAAQLDMSPHTIRFYEEKGLVCPQRTAGNQRIYTTKDRARLKLILRGKRFGFTLDEIAEMIGMADNQMNELSQIEKSISYGKEKLEEIQKRKEELELLEKDMLALYDSLVKRRTEIQKK